MNPAVKSTTEANPDASTMEANNMQSTTEYGLNRPDSSTQNQPIAGSCVNQRHNWRKAKAKKKQELKQLGMHVRSRPFLVHNTKAFVSKRDRNRFMKKLHRRVARGDVKGVRALQPPPGATHALRDRFLEFINNYAKWAPKVNQRLRPHNTANGARFKFMKAMRSCEMRQLASPDKIKRTIRKFRQRNHIGALTRRLEKEKFPDEV